MRGVRAVAVWLGLLLPGIAWGADLRLSISGASEYDSNVFRSEEDEKGDVVFRVTPHIVMVEDREKFNYSVGYQLPYEVAVKYNDQDEVNDFNHFFDAGFRYRVTPQTEVYADDSFYYAHGLFRQQESTTDPVLGDLGDNRGRVLNNDVSLGVTHNFTPRLSGSLRVRQGIYDTTQDFRSNALTFGGVASGAYQLTEQHQVGGGFNYARQMFDDTFNRPGSNSDYYNLFGSWEWLFDETTTFSIQAGPALIYSDQDGPPATINQQQIPYSDNNDGTITAFAFQNCPVVDGNTLLFNPGGETCSQILVDDAGAIATITGLPNIDYTYPAGFEPGGVTDTRLTYFANASLTKRWTPNLASSLGYVREENVASGIDGAAVMDAVTATTTWRISERWDASVRADWTLRQSATEGARVYVSVAPQIVAGVPVPVAAGVPDGLVTIDSADSLDSQRWGVAGRLAYRLTKNTVTALQYAYNRQSSEGDTVGEASDFDDHLVTFTVQYNFEPIGLWW
jgi:hypothetical protein